MTGHFLVECYRPESSPGWLGRASPAIDVAGDPEVRCVDAILVPEDRVAFFLLEATSLEAACAAVAEAGVHVDRASPSERASLQLPH